MTARRLWGGVGASCAFAVAAAAVLRPVPGPATPPRAALGLLAGVLLFALVRGRPAGPALQLPPAGPALVLAGAALAEETAWRLGALGALRHVLPAPAALALVSVGFGLAHVGSQGRPGAVFHTLTGAWFGVAFLATGSLAAAAGAHAAYNLLVAAAARAGTGPLPALAAAPAALLEHVAKQFGVTRALDGVSLEVRPGEIVGLLGPNGAGKTTACSLLLGLRRPDAGRALVFGHDPRSPPARRRLGTAPQEPAFPPTLRVAEIADLVARHAAAPEPVDTILGRFGLERQARRQAGGLSGGRRRLLAVALACAGAPDLLVLDEPTAALDLDARRLVREAIRARARAGCAVLLTTHDLAEAESLADRVVVLAGGRIVAEGPLERIRGLVGLATIVVPAQALPPLPGLVSAERQGGVTRLTVRDAGEAVRALALAGGVLDGIAVRPASLEEAVAAAVARA